MQTSGDRDAVIINYAARTAHRPRYYANDHSKDTVVIDARPMPLHDVRGEATSVDDAGFALVSHKSAVTDFTDRETAGRIHRPEIAELLRTVTGADEVIVTAPPIMRFSERSGRAGQGDNSYPARFVHVDLSDPTGRQFAQRTAPEGARFVRAAHYNVWRALSGPPQDVPLGLCDNRSLQGDELIEADAIFDRPEGDSQFEGYVVAHHPAHRWCWYPDLRPDEAIIFKTHDSREGVARLMPHVGFDDPLCADDAPPRISIEMRGIAYWWD